MLAINIIPCSCAAYARPNLPAELCANANVGRFSLRSLPTYLHSGRRSRGPALSLRPLPYLRAAFAAAVRGGRGGAVECGAH